jgi:hypothetical protein
MTDDVWTLEIYAPCAWLTANVERHYQSRATKVRKWREAVVDVCAIAQLPHGVTPVRIAAAVRYAGRRPVRDRLNLAPTIKACVDALTPARTFTRGGKTYVTAGYGLLPDDDDRHVVDTVWDLVPIDPFWLRGAIGRVDLKITANAGTLLDPTLTEGAST